MTAGPVPEIDLTECPKCKGTGGYYCKYVATYSQFWEFGGEPFYASEPHLIKGGYIVFCADCHKQIAKWGKSIQQWIYKRTSEKNQ